MLDQLNDRLIGFLRGDERKPVEMRMEGYKEELDFRDMKDIYFRIDEANQKMHEDRMRHLENLFRWNSMTKKMERLLEKNRQDSREMEQVLLRQIKHGRRRKIEAPKCSPDHTQTELKQKSHGTQTQIDWLTDMRQHGGEKKDIIQSNEPPFLQDAQRQKAEKQVPQAKTTLEDDLLGDMNAGDKWGGIKKGHEQSQAASTQKLDKHRNNQGQDREKNKGEMINMRTRGNEDVDTDDGERKHFGVSEENADRASGLRNSSTGTQLEDQNM